MLFNAKMLKNFTLDSLDGNIGKTKDFYFDDLHWTIRYLVADTGNWISERKVLISPYSIIAVNDSEDSIGVSLTNNQIEKSPSINSDKPVSKQFELDYSGYYGWPLYWSGPFMWGAYPTISLNFEESEKSTDTHKAWDPHLRSMQEVIGYYIQATDGEVGHVEDFIIDDETWAIRYLVINTRNWLPGKSILVSPQWIQRVSWSDSKVYVNLSRESIKASPEFTIETLPTRDYEIRLHEHYARTGYWMDERLVHDQIR